MLEKSTLQEVFPDYDVQVSDDGTRAIGRRIPQKKESTETPEARIIPITAFKGPDSTIKIYANEFMAQLADLEARDLEIEADAKIRKIEDLKHELSYYKKKLVKFRRRRKLARKTIPAQTIGLGAIGFFLGVLLAISELLTEHGPTVTLFGTLGACGIYLLGGLVFGGLFLWLGREQGIAFVQDYSAKIKSYAAAAEEVRDEIAKLQTDAGELAKHARAKRKEAWQCRGLI